LKQEHRLDRNRLKGALGDRINALLSAAGSEILRSFGSTSQAAVCCCCGSVLRWSLIGSGADDLLLTSQNIAQIGVFQDQLTIIPI